MLFSHRPFLLKKLMILHLFRCLSWASELTRCLLVLFLDFASRSSSRSQLVESVDTCLSGLVFTFSMLSLVRLHLLTVMHFLALPVAFDNFLVLWTVFLGVWISERSFAIALLFHDAQLFINSCYNKTKWNATSPDRTFWAENFISFNWPLLNWLNLKQSVLEELSIPVYIMFVPQMFHASICCINSWYFGRGLFRCWIRMRALYVYLLSGPKVSRRKRLCVQVDRVLLGKRGKQVLGWVKGLSFVDWFCCSRMLEWNWRHCSRPRAHDLVCAFDYVYDYVPDYVTFPHLWTTLSERSEYHEGQKCIRRVSH